MPRLPSEDTGSLEKYWQKRNFVVTPEPKGTRAKKKPMLQFVIQKHAASHLHYDFRLELDGVLKSWAVPKGPSLDPHDKRLAVHVEDHPLEYANFEGTIPTGNYGAGSVIVWDNGEWEPIGDAEESYRSGRLKFELRGKKLQGIWNLVRSRSSDKKNQTTWFLIKHADAAARPSNDYSIVDAEPDSVFSETVLNPVSRSEKKRRIIKQTKQTALPQTLTPQLATLVDRIPSTGNWVYEIKYDGYRLLVRIDGGSVKLFTRNGNNWTAKLPHLAKALSQLPLDSGWLDGEIVMLDEHGQPSFQKLQNAFENESTEKIHYYLFDIPFANGNDLREQPFTERRATLEVLLKEMPNSISLSTVFDVSAKKLFENACAMHLEGLIGKRANSPYQSARSRDWIKLKCIQRQEFIIGGYTDPAGSRTGSFGALLLGVHEPKTGKLRYVGRVGTGFTQATLRALTQKLKPLLRDTMPFDQFTGEKPTRAMHWVEPQLIGEVAFSEWTANGHLRHPSFQGLRSDKSSSDVTAEKPIATALVESRVTSTQKRSTKKTVDNEVDGIHITHSDRVIDTHSGLTKGDVVRYYEKISSLILPHLIARPVSLVRAPSNIDGQQFFQKHLNNLKIPHLRELDPRFLPGHPPLLCVDSKMALLECAQMNVIEFHTWNASTEAIDRPDRMIFDLDPGEGIAWEQIQQAAELTHTLLDEIGLKSFLKTSGGKGLHIMVPIEPAWDWDAVKGFSAAIAQHLAATLPQLFVAKSGPKNRVNRIFVDYLRNGYGATAACAFSARARPQLPVSIPITWKELRNLRSSAQWTIRDIDAIITLAKKNPWRTAENLHQSLLEPAKKIGFELKGKT